MAEDVTDNWPLDALEEKVGKAFPGTVTIERVVLEERGVAADRYRQHVVAKTAEGPDYGIKLAPRDQEDLTFEALGYDLALRVEAPNACRASRVEPHSGFPREFGQHCPLFIERMEGNIVPVSALNDASARQEAQESIRDNSVSFLKQFGEWFVLTAFMGTEDRHGENLIWDMEEAKLLHVDFGQGFDECVPEPHLRSQLRLAAMTTVSAQDVTTATRDFLASALVDGMKNMDQKLRDARQEVLSRLKDAGLDDSYIEEAREWIDTDIEEKVRLVRKLLP